MKSTILFLCLLLTLTSCSSDDRIPIQINDPDSLNGSWTMVNIYGGFAGIDDDYEPGQIVWTFDEEDETLIVDNSVGDAPITSGLDSGTYDYHVETEEEIDYLFIDGYNSGEYFIDSDTLTIDDNPGADGFRYTFEKFSE